MRDGEEVERRMEENVREWDGKNGGRTKKKIKDNVILIEGLIMGQLRNIAQAIFPGIHQNDPQLRP